MDDRRHPGTRPANPCIGIIDAEESSHGVWLVQLTNDEMVPMPLAELMQAFRNGVVNEQTLVLSAGSFQWRSLGEIAR
jgi:hypothetical protein